MNWTAYNSNHGCSALLDFVTMLYRDDYIALFVPFFYISMSFGNLFKRIVSIYDRFNLSRLHKIFEENYIFNADLCDSLPVNCHV